MARTRFWDDLFGNGAARLDAALQALEVPDIRRLPDSLTRVVIDHLVEDQRALREQNAHLAHELLRMHAVVTVLANVLIEQGVVEEAALRWQIQDALRAVDPPSIPPPPPEAGGEPYRSSGPRRASPSALDPKLVCTGCHRDVPVETTIVTEDGPLCDECFRQMQLATFP